MKTQFIANSLWSTSSYGDTVDTSPMELSALGAHLDLCRKSHGRWFAIHCIAETLHGFAAPRMVTTLLAVGLLFGGVSLWL